MKQTLTLLTGLLLLAAGTFTAHCASVTFGTGGNQFTMDFVEIGDPGNADDTTGNPDPAGSVNYHYQMGKFEISEDMIDKANAEGALGITKDTRGPNRPATSISWFEAATFVNWLNTSSGATPAYKFDGGGNFQLWQSGDTGFNASNPYRNSQAIYVLPSMDEWYKAAYYDPSSGTYFDYPTGSDSMPDGIDFAGDTTFDAVFLDPFIQSGPNDITNAGLLSPYGTMGQGGNAREWEETAFDLSNDSATEDRGLRGGAWTFDFDGLLSLDRNNGVAANENFNSGFRVAVVPEVSRAVLAVIGLTGVLLRRRPGSASL